MALITTTEELKQFLRIPATNIDSRLPSMNVAEQKYLIPVLGNALYNRLVDAYEAETLTPELEQLLKRSRAVIAPLGYLNDLPTLQVTLSDNGVIALESENTRKAFKWEYNEVKEALSEQGYGAMEALIVYLKENRILFPEWETAPYNDAEQVFIVPDGNVLRQAVSLQQPHRCFLMLLPLLPSVCDLLVIPTISQEYFEHINARIITGDLDTKEKVVAKALQAAVARYAMAQACIELSIRFSGQGFTIVDQSKDQPDDGRTAATDAKLNRFRDEMTRIGNSYMDSALQYLIKHADEPEFAVFKASAAYPKEGQRITDNGNDRRRIFVS